MRIQRWLFWGSCGNCLKINLPSQDRLKKKERQVEASAGWQEQRMRKSELSGGVLAAGSTRGGRRWRGVPVPQDQGGRVTGDPLPRVPGKVKPSFLPERGRRVGRKRNPAPGKERLPFPAPRPAGRRALAAHARGPAPNSPSEGGRPPAARTASRGGTERKQGRAGGRAGRAAEAAVASTGAQGPGSHRRALRAQCGKGPATRGPPRGDSDA